MLFTLIVIVLILFIIDRCRSKSELRLHKQLNIGWTYFPIIGHAYKFFGNTQDLYESLNGASSLSYNRSFGTTSFWLGFKFIVAISDPVQAVAVLKTAYDKTFFNKFFSFFLGNGIVFSPRDVWLRRRKVVAPTFAPRYVSKFVRVFEANAKFVVEQLESKVNNGNFSCWSYVCAYGMDSVCETILGVKIGAMRQPDQPFSIAFMEHIKNVALRVFNPIMQIEPIYRLLPVYKRQIHTRKIIHGFVDNIICEKKKLLSTNHNNNPNNWTQDEMPFKTFLELMMESSKESKAKYTNEELREDALAMLIAGTDTTTTAICFIMVLLSQHQDVQEKVYQEINKICGDVSNPIKHEDLNELKYLEAVIKETLRLYPPIPLINRDTDKELVLLSGLKVPSRSELSVNISGIQRNPHYWGSDANLFRPERFISDSQIPGAFMAFSYGTRNCPGQLYAMLSMKTTLVTILRQYRLVAATSFSYDDRNPLRVSFEIMIKHVDNFEIQIAHRHESSNMEKGE